MKEQIEKLQKDLKKLEELRASDLYFCSEVEIALDTGYALRTIFNYQYPRTAKPFKIPMPKPTFVYGTGGGKKVNFWLKTDIKQWKKEKEKEKEK
jgi:hypothetical protein